MRGAVEDIKATKLRILTFLDVLECLAGPCFMDEARIAGATVRASTISFHVELVLSSLRPQPHSLCSNDTSPARLVQLAHRFVVDELVKCCHALRARPVGLEERNVGFCSNDVYVALDVLLRAMVDVESQRWPCVHVSSVIDRAPVLCK